MKDNYSESGLILVECKKEEPKLDDIYQARRYGELFDATHAFLVSLERIPEELKRLHKAVYSLLSLPRYETETLASLDESEEKFVEWYPGNPFIGNQ